METAIYPLNLTLYKKMSPIKILRFKEGGKDTKRILIFISYVAKIYDTTISYTSPKTEKR